MKRLFKERSNREKKEWFEIRVLRHGDTTRRGFLVLVRKKQKSRSTVIASGARFETITDRMDSSRLQVQVVFVVLLQNVMLLFVVHFPLCHRYVLYFNVLSNFAAF